jgi:hypothetical protein
VLLVAERALAQFLGLEQGCLLLPWWYTSPLFCSVDRLKVRRDPAV